MQVNPDCLKISLLGVGTTLSILEGEHFYPLSTFLSPFWTPLTP